MGTEFGYFLEVIPPEMYARTKATICRYIAIFEPKEYALGRELCVDDYHFILFLENPPVIWINDSEYQVKKGDMLAVKPWDRVYVPGRNEVYGRYLHIAIKKDFFREIAGETAGEKDFELKRVHSRFSSRLLDLIGDFQSELMNYGEAYPRCYTASRRKSCFSCSAIYTPGRKRRGRGMEGTTRTSTKPFCLCRRIIIQV